MGVIRRAILKDEQAYWLMVNRGFIDGNGRRSIDNLPHGGYVSSDTNCRGYSARNPEKSPRTAYFHPLPHPRQRSL